MDTNVSPVIASGIAAVTAPGDRARYDGIARSLHWLTALLVLAQFGLAELWSFPERPTRHLMIVTHMSLGILLTLVLAVRIVWRLIPGRQIRAAASGWAEVASKLVHSLLYVLLAAEAALGFVLRWSGDQAMSFFGLLIPPPFAPFSRPAHHLVGEVHDWIGWTIITLAADHALAALFHHFVLRDGVLRRMLP
jgi:cytochrome b561